MGEAHKKGYLTDVDHGSEYIWEGIDDRQGRHRDFYGLPQYAVRVRIVGIEEWRSIRDCCAIASNEYIGILWSDEGGSVSRFGIRKGIELVEVYYVFRVAEQSMWLKRYLVILHYP